MKFYKIGWIFVLTIALNPLVHTQNLHRNSGLLTYTDVQGEIQPVKSLYDWQVKRAQILDSLQAALGPLPEDPLRPPFVSDLPELPPFDTRIKDSLETRFYTCYDIEFTVAASEKVSAYLYIPQKKHRHPFPAVIALHETDEGGKKSVDAQGYYLNMGYGKELAERGYVVIAPDYPSFGDQKDYDFHRDRYDSGMMKSIFNNIRCVDFLQSRKDVDPERIGIIGHSLGGHGAMFTAAFETRIKVVVSSCGWTLFDFDNRKEEEDYIRLYGGRLGDWATDRYMPLLQTRYHLDSGKIPFDFDEVIAAIAPRPFFTSSPRKDRDFDVSGVQVGIANGYSVYRFLNAEKDLQAIFPDSKHDFPPFARQEAYSFLDKYLKDYSFESN